MNYKQLTIDAFDTGKIINTCEDSQGCRFQHLEYCLPLVSIPGEVLEFGVYKGSTINLISDHFSNDIIYGFDSFEGLPEDWDFSYTNTKFRKGTFALNELPIVNKNVKLVKGWFDVSLPGFLSDININTIKLLHVDCDLYSSTKTVLTLLNDYIVTDTIIIFDEMFHWGNQDKNKTTYTNWQQGEYLALKEWMREYDREIEVISRNKYMQCCIKVL